MALVSGTGLPLEILAADRKRGNVWKSYYVIVWLVELIRMVELVRLVGLVRKSFVPVPSSSSK